MVTDTVAITHWLVQDWVRACRKEKIDVTLENAGISSFYPLLALPGGWMCSTGYLYPAQVASSVKKAAEAVVVKHELTLVVCIFVEQISRSSS